MAPGHVKSKYQTKGKPKPIWLFSVTWQSLKVKYTNNLIVYSIFGAYTTQVFENCEVLTAFPLCALCGFPFAGFARDFSRKGRKVHTADKNAKPSKPIRFSKPYRWGVKNWHFCRN
jgi:hypothetical protein